MQLTNPIVMASCGLPATWARFTSTATVRTFNMTSDCDFSTHLSTDGFLHFQVSSGEFTVNGNGYSIIGPPNAYVFYVDRDSTLNLNNVTIRQSGGSTDITVGSGGRLNGSSLTFRNSNAESIVSVSGEAMLKNVQFLDNQKSSGSVGILGTGSSSIILTNGVFRGNTVLQNLSYVYLASGTSSIELRCVVFANNSYPDGMAAPGYSTGVIVRGCSKSKKKEKVPTPTPTATPRPAYGASYVALQTATGMTFKATYGLDSGVHFRQLDGAGIGVQSIIDAGYLEAFDVYGYVEQGVEVCFPQIGRVIFLDARTMPRAITPLESTVVNGQTCVSINSPGSLVLLPN